MTNQTAPESAPSASADSTKASQDSAALDTQSPTSSGPGLGTIPERFLLVYPLVFMLPFPLTILGALYQIPGYNDTFFAKITNWLFGLHGQATQPIVSWLGRQLTGETPSFAFTGSGDGLAAYLGVLLVLCTAVVLTLLWWLWRRSTPISRRTADFGRVMLRYYLALVMLSYGFSKVFPTQFSTMGPDRLLQPYGDSSPMGLLWTFMGASPGYQMFAGAAEVLGGLLLLFRRTTLLGALVVAAVMTNVFAMNMFFDVPVKLFSFHYLLFATFLLVPDLRRLVAVFVTNTAVPSRDLRPFWHDSRRWRRVLGVTKVVLIITLLSTNTFPNYQWMKTRGLLAPKGELHGIYEVESFTVSAASAPEPDGAEPDGAESAETEPDGAEPAGAEPAGAELASAEPTDTEPAIAVTDDVRWIRIGINPPRIATVQHANGTAVRMRMRIDEEASTLALFDRSLSEPDAEPLRYERLDDQRLRLSGVFNDVPIVVVLKLDETERLFHSRGFNWINEYPFNR